MSEMQRDALLAALRARQPAEPDPPPAPHGHPPRAPIPLSRERTTPPAPPRAAPRGEASPTGKETQAGAIVRLAERLYTFHTSDAGEPCAVAKSGPPIARLLRGGREGLRAALAHRFAHEQDRAPSAAALADAILVIEGRCLTAGRVALDLRVARRADTLVLDLGRADGQVVTIRPDGWSVGPTPAGIIWRRTELTGELPLPERGGSLDALRRELNVTPTSWLFFRAALLAALLPDVPAPVLLFRGPQGSGKSSAARVFAQLVDPSAAPLRAAPTRPDEWQIAAAGSRVVALDNVSTIPAWLSDAICRASTGDGLVKRRLYADDALIVLSYRRLVALTSIDTGALRGDLADRLLPIELERIAPEHRRLDADLAAAFTAGHPRWLGAVLDLLAALLAALPGVRLAAYPRLADFGRLLAAADAVTGTDGLARYLALGEHLAAEVVEGDAVAAALVTWLGERTIWTGTAADLLAALTPDRPLKGWPATPHHLAGRLRRAGEPLRGVGLTVTFDRERRTRTITIERVGAETSPASPAPPAGDLDSATGDAHGDADDDPGPQSHTERHTQTGPAESETGVGDARDADDAGVPTLSIEEARGWLLRVGEARGWPHLADEHGDFLHAGQVGWRRVLPYLTDERVMEACAAARRLLDRTA